MLKMLLNICITYTTCVSNKCIYLISPFSLQIFCQSPDQPCSYFDKKSSGELGVFIFLNFQSETVLLFFSTAYDINYSIIDLRYLIHHHTRRKWKILIIFSLHYYRISLKVLKEDIKRICIAPELVLFF